MSYCGKRKPAVVVLCVQMPEIGCQMQMGWLAEKLLEFDHEALGVPGSKDQWTSKAEDNRTSKVKLRGIRSASSHVLLTTDNPDIASICDQKVCTLSTPRCHSAAPACLFD